MEYIKVSDAAQRWDISMHRVQEYCKNGRIPGVIRFGKIWLIPADAARPLDGRSKAVKAAKEIPASQPLLRKSPFLDMTDLYNAPGNADKCAEALLQYPEAHALFTAEIAYSRGEIDKVYAQANYFLENHTGFYAILSGGLLLSLCAMWKGDLQMWYKARKHILEAPCKGNTDRDIVSLTLAAADSAIRNTNDFPDWFVQGCFDNLPRDSHPAARVYYGWHLLIFAQELALNNIKLDGLYGFGLMKTLPYIVEPMISQMVVDKVVMAEIYLRLLVAVAYHQCGDDIRGGAHLDKAIHLCLADGLYGPLVEHRQQLGLFLDDHLARIDPDALRKVKSLHKQLHTGWTKIHNAVLERTVQESLTIREREVARLAAFGLTNHEIGKQLSLSSHTVNSLLISAKNKIGVENRTELGLYI